MSNGSSVSRTDQLLEEILKWIKFSGAKGVKDALVSALNSDQKRLIYDLSDGKESSAEIGKQAGVSDWTVRSYWKAWARQGIMEAVKFGTGDRYKKSFDLEDFGLSVPQSLPPVAATGSQAQVTSQEQESQS